MDGDEADAHLRGAGSSRGRLRGSERLREVHESVVDLEPTPSQRDHSGHAYWIDACVYVAQLRIETARGDIALLADAEADAVPAPFTRFLLRCVRELSCDPAAPPLWQDEDVLDLRKAQVCPDPRDVRVPDRLIAVPGDEVG